MKRLVGCRMMPPVRDSLIGGARGGMREVRGGGQEGAQGGIERINTGQAGLGEFEAGGLALAQEGGGFMQGEISEDHSAGV